MDLIPIPPAVVPAADDNNTVTADEEKAPPSQPTLSSEPPSKPGAAGAAVVGRDPRRRDVGGGGGRRASARLLRSSMTSMSSIIGGGGPGDGRLSVKGFNFQIPTDHGTRHHVEDTHGKHSLEYQILVKLHSHKVQLILMLLLLLDVLLLFIEIFLLATYPSCSTIIRDSISCCPTTTTTTTNATSEEEEEHHRFLEVSENDHEDDHHEDGHHEDICLIDGLEPMYDYDAGCDGHKWSTVHTIEEILFILTITILSIFFIELNITLWAVKLHIFSRQLFLVLDYIVVTGSLILELTFHFLDDTTIQSIVGLLIVARIWRFLRISHGIVEVVQELSHSKYQTLLTYAEELELLLENHNIDIPESISAALLSSIKHKDHDHILAEIEKHERQKHYHISSSKDYDNDDKGGGEEEERKEGGK